MTTAPITPTPQAVPRKTATKTTAKTPAAPKQAVAKRAAPKAAAPAKALKTTKSAKPAGPAKGAKAPKASKAAPAREALVRDSFTMPRADVDLIAKLKALALSAKRAAKKSELLRAGLKALSALDAKALVAALDALPVVKAGRPKKKS